MLKLHDDSMVGIIMEKANGNNVVKTLKDPGFCNVSTAATALLHAPWLPVHHRAVRLHASAAVQNQ